MTKTKQQIQDEIAELQELPELLPVCFTFLQALKTHSLLEKEGVELYCKGMGYAISWRKLNE